MKKTLAALSAIYLLSACAAFQTDYVVKENSEHSSFAPAWTVQSRAYRIDSYAQTKQFLYFVGEANDPKQRLCRKYAEKDAVQKTASDAAQKIMRRFEQKKNESALIAPELKNKLEKNILVNLQGSITAGKYWEKRDYLKEKGAKSNYTTYKCNVVNKIKKSDLAETLEASKAKATKALSDKDKKAADKAIDAYIADLKR